MSKSKFLKNALKKVTKSNTFNNVLSSLMYAYIKFVYKTSQWQINGLEELQKTWKEHKNFILVGWHGRALMMPLMFHTGDYPEMKALVSLHNDGRLIAGILERFGIKTIGGSTSNNAKGAAVNIMHTLNQGSSVTIIPDGPRGPRMKMTMSPLYFAQKSQKPVIGLVYSVKKAKIIEKAWDKMMIPAPFNQGTFLFTKPFFIPQNATEEELKSYCLQLENEMNKLQKEADLAMGQTPIEPGTEVKTKRKIKEI